MSQPFSAWRRLLAPAVLLAALGQWPRPFVGRGSQRSGLPLRNYPRGGGVAARAADPKGQKPIVVLGAGLQGAALAYYLAQRGAKVLVVERDQVAAAASGKGGGFLARDWGDSITRKLHTVSFKLHEELAEALEIQSYRKLPVLSASRSRSRGSGEICPWLDGDVDVRVMDPNGAQVSPHELCTKLMAAAQAAGAELRIGAAEGVEMETDGDIERVTGVKVDGEVLEAEKVCVCLGPWAALAEDWFGMPVPMTGVKSSSIVYQTKSEVEPFAVFCGEDSRYGTHLEIYPRNSGEVYICGIGGSQYIDAATLRGENGGLLPSEVEPDPQRVEAATACFSEMSRKLGGKPDVVQACMRPCPPDALPIMGKVPHVKNAYISAGHNCWGILWAPVSGKAMSELILDGAAKCVDLRHFRPGRFAKSGTQAARRGRKMGTVPVGEQW